MSNSGYGQAPKKETVYSGPAPTLRQGTVYSGPSVQTSGGTVYNGPAVGTGGTVYNGPSAGGTVYSGPSVGGTVYNPAPQAPAAGAKAVASPPVASGNALFLIAGLSLVNTVLAISGAPIALALGLGITRVFDVALKRGGALGPVIAINLAVVGVFALLGVFARKGSGAAILIGLLLYAGDTVILVLDGVGLHIVSLIVHGIFLVTIFKGYAATRS